MNWSTVIRSLKNRDMRRRLLAVIGMLIAYRALAHTPVPLTEPSKLSEVIANFVRSTDFGGFLNLLSGGAIAQLSIVLVGLSPFITASIIVQLLTRAIPRLEEIHKDGEAGRRKLNQWTRVLAVPLAVIQSITFIYILRQTVLAGNVAGLSQPTLSDWIVSVVAMTAGSMLLMWLGELITEQGVGNGVSLLIFAGIISQAPQSLGTIAGSLFDTSAGSLNVFNWFTLPVNPTAFYVSVAITAVSILLLYWLVKINEAQRVITINYAKRVHGNSAYGGVKSILPIKLIAAGVIPVIFAVAFLSLPAFVGQFLRSTGKAEFAQLATNLINWFSAPQPGSFVTGGAGAFVYPVLYFLLVIMFTYFYTGIVLNAKEIAENMQKQGGFFEGVRPGLQTERYLSKVVNRLMLFGSISLGIIAVLPFVAQYAFSQLGISVANLAVGGTGTLIVVTVGLETMRQINSRALMITYDDYK